MLVNILISSWYCNETGPQKTMIVSKDWNRTCVKSHDVENQCFDHFTLLPLPLRRFQNSIQIADSCLFRCSHSHFLAERIEFPFSLGCSGTCFLGLVLVSIPTFHLPQSVCFG